MRKNVTRRSSSIPRRLVREGALHLLPVYGLLRLSDLASEAVEHSGSYRFADHIYVGAPSGRTALGRWLDARLLAMPAACAFRRRCAGAQRAMRQALERPGTGRAVRILAVPCGIPRDLIELARTLRRENRELLLRLEYHGMDVDPAALEVARAFTDGCGAGAVHYHQGDALAARDYFVAHFDLVVSTGLGEFLQDDELATFYTHVYDALEPGGTFYTSVTARDRRSDVLLRMVELESHYRSAEDVAEILRRLPWTQTELDLDPTGLQTFVTARRGG